jgi:hypothetical protein
MKNEILITLLLLSFTSGIGNSHTLNSNVSTETKAIKGFTFILVYQLFESKDHSATQIDTVRHPGDYIFFSDGGKAYMNYNGRLDSIDYFFPDKQSVSFGDTPFAIINIGRGFITLFQDEQEANGDYNRVSYLLKMKKPLLYTGK